MTQAATLEKEELSRTELEHLLGRIGPRNRPTPLWGSGEHISIGDEITLFFSKTDYRAANKTKLAFGNGHALTYGQILALAGDFYGLPGAPISEGGGSVAEFHKITGLIEKFLAEAPKIFTLVWATWLLHMKDLPKILEQTGAFLATPASAQDPAKPGYFRSTQDLFGQAFATLAEAPNSEIDKVLALIGQDGKDGTDFEAELTETYRYAQATHGRYMALLLTNWDHFGRYAWTAYRAGHTAALVQAVKARSTGKPADLELAFAMNAFADHYLTDLFSGGHIRNPRKRLAEQSALGSFASLWMHNEDSSYGVLVRNQRGDCWVAYGDGEYSINWNRRNRRILFEAVQTSANQISEAFVTGSFPKSDEFPAVARLIPDVAQAERYDQQNNVATAINSAPMFIDNRAASTVQIRKDLDDLFCWHWEGGWEGVHLISTVKRWHGMKPSPGGGVTHPGLSGETSPVPVLVDRYYQPTQAEKKPPKTGYGHISRYRPKGVPSLDLDIPCAALPLQVDGTHPVVLYRLENDRGYSIYYLRLEKKPMTPPTSFESLGVAFYAFAEQRPGTIPVYLHTGMLATGPSEQGPQVYTYSAESTPPPGYTGTPIVAFYAYPAPSFGRSTARQAELEA